MKLKLSINDKLANACKRALNTGKKLANLAVDYGTATALILIMSYGALKLPELHNHYLRYEVGQKVYMIRDSAHSGGGTGFAVQAPSGQSYILTNDHVCGVSSDKQTVFVTDERGESMRRRIVAHDEYSDLCLIEGLPGVEGLKVAWAEPINGETLNVVGHPRLMPLHVSSGEMTGKQTIQVSMGPISVTNPQTGEEAQIPEEVGGVLPENCQMAKNRQVDQEIDLGFFQIKVKFCVIEIKDAYISTATIHPGNSGSPVVNFWGNVEGVAFAADSTNWGRLVSLADIKAFLKNY